MNKLTVLTQEDGRDKLGNARSGKWTSLRNAILLTQPWCTVCSSRLNLIVHHIKPFHLQPELELSPANLIVLCEGVQGHYDALNCHYVFGHNGDWKKFNPTVDSDTVALRRILGLGPRQQFFPNPTFTWSHK